MTAGSEKKAASGSEKTNDALNRTIERAKQELEHMIDLNPQIMLLVNRSGVVVRTNKALLDLLLGLDLDLLSARARPCGRSRPRRLPRPRPVGLVINDVHAYASGPNPCPCPALHSSSFVPGT